MQDTITIEHPSVGAVNELTDMWVELAADQREYESYIQPEESREAVREMIAHRIASDCVYAAYAETDAQDQEQTQILGFVTYEIERGAYALSETRGIIQNLYVTPSKRGAGIGTQLLCAAEDKLHDQGATVITLETLAENARAQEFYRQQGYDAHRVQFERTLDFTEEN
jgi:ribosomal protein S18 acetylase RimI-like enzyme